MIKPSSIRLQKAIADAGVCSRRKAEELITAGFVRVNGKKVTTLGTKIDPANDSISVKGKALQEKKRFLYYAFHKPVNVIVTTSDPEGRPTIFDYLKKIESRVYPVGRLDFDSEGLLLLTNDGALTNKLTHPKHQVSKTYEVKIAGHLAEKDQKKLQSGILLEEGKTQPAHIEIFKKNPHNCWLRMTITEGKNRQIRKMLESVRHEVLKLKRTSIAEIKLGGLKVGLFRSLTREELKRLKALA